MGTVQKNLISLEPVALDDGKELFGNFMKFILLPKLNKQIRLYLNISRKSKVF